MTRTRLTLLVLAALTTGAPAARADATQDTTQAPTRPGARRAPSEGASARRAPTRTRTVRRAAGDSIGMRDEANPRAHPRDWVRADDTTCDDLCRREQMMDSKYGKDRERLPASARTPRTPSPTP